MEKVLCQKTLIKIQFTIQKRKLNIPLKILRNEADTIGMSVETSQSKINDKALCTEQVDHGTQHF